AFRLAVMSPLLRRALDRGDDAVIGAAPAEVRLHVLDDLAAAGAAVLLEERRGAHDLARLAVAALRHLLRHPRLLQWVLRVGREPFDGRDGLPCHVLDLEQAGESGLAVDMDRARAALADAAAVLGAGHAEVLAQDPEERRVGMRGDGAAGAVHG